MALEGSSSFKILFDKFLANTCTPDEVKQVLDILGSPGENSEASQLLLKQLLRDLPANHVWDPALQDRLAKRFRLILEQTNAEHAPLKPQKKFYIGWRQLVAAAAIAVTAVAGFYMYTSLNPAPKPVVEETLKKPTPDIAAPTAAHAVITLADGTQIILDSARNGSLTGNLTKLNDDQLSYVGQASSKIEYHTLTVPKGSKLVKLVLADGTKVWINAASSLHYPTAFPGESREVTITGEAYFEVAKDASKKFIVNANGTTTEVLGTHFNVNAYEDESDMKITLLEGSVMVNREGESGIL